MDAVARANQQTAIYVVLLFVLIGLVSLFVWLARKRNAEPFTVLIAGEPHSGKTRLFYALTAGCEPETVVSAQPSTYTGCLDACPGVVMRIVDWPSDPRARGGEFTPAQADLILYCASGPDAASPDWKSLVYGYLVPLRAVKPRRRHAFRGPGPFSRIAVLAPSEAKARGWNSGLSEYMAAEGLAARKPGEVSFWLEKTAKEQLWAGVNALALGGRGVRKAAPAHAETAVSTEAAPSAPSEPTESRAPAEPAKE